MHYAAPKLHKVGEFGHGRVILCIYSGTHYHHHPFLLSQNLDKSKKVYVYFLDLNRDKRHSDDALVDTLNKFHFVKDLIVDFPTFVRIAENFKKIDLIQKGIDTLILFNPIKPRTTILRRLFGYEYINLNNEKIKLNKKKLHHIFQFYKNIPEIQVKKFDVISFQDIRATVRVCTFFNNSKLRPARNFDEGLNVIHKIT